MIYRFGVYEHNLVVEGNLVTKHLIVIKDGENNIVRWTNLHTYCKGDKYKAVRSITASDRTSCYFNTKLLNYVYFEKYHIKNIKELTPQMVINFFQDYGMCRLQEDTPDTSRNKETVERCINFILRFLSFLSKDEAYLKNVIDELYYTEDKWDKMTRKFRKALVPKFTVYHKAKEKECFRDIVNGAFKIIFNEIRSNHKNLLMLFALGAFAGLRPSEACNVRREDSPLGPGITFKIYDGDVEDIFIHIEEDKVLRSDLKNVGKIKRYRTQKVYRQFIPEFLSCYQEYMDYIKGKKYEAKYAPLTVNRNGKAYTYESYIKDFRKITRNCINTMLSSNNNETVNYGMLLQENNISPHILRHWFTVQLLLAGENEVGIQTWRGDKNIESALTYLQRKSEIEKEFGKVSDEMFDYMMWKAEVIHHAD